MTMLHHRLALMLPMVVIIGCNNPGNNNNDLSGIDMGGVGMVGGDDLSMPMPPPPDMMMSNDDLTMMVPDLWMGPPEQALKFDTAGLIYLSMVDGTSPVIAGELFNSSSFGGKTLISAGGGDAYVAKISPAGMDTWAFGYGDAMDQLAGCVTANKNGVILVGGAFAGTINFSPTISVSTATESSFLAAFDGATGAALWAQTIELTGGSVDSVSADPQDGNFVVSATTRGAAKLGTFTGTWGGGQDLFAAKIKPAGDIVWARQIGGVKDQISRGITVDGNSNVTVVGQYNGTLDFGTGALTTPAGLSKHMFIARLDANSGAAKAAVDVGGPKLSEQQLAATVAAASNGDVVIAGYLAGGPVTFATAASDAGAGGILLTPLGQDGFVARLDSNLKALWALRIGDPVGTVSTAVAPQEAKSVAIDSTGKVVVVGRMATNGMTPSSVDFGLGAPTSVIGGSTDGFALKVDGITGAPLWARTTKGHGSVSANAVVTDNSNQVWIAGSFLSSAQPGDGPIPNWGTSLGTELVFPMDNGTVGHTFLVQLAP